MNTDKMARIVYAAESAALFCVVAHESYRRLVKAEEYAKQLPESHQEALRGAADKARAALLPAVREICAYAQKASADVQGMIEKDGRGYVPYGQQARFAAVDAKNAADALEGASMKTARQRRLVLN